MSKMESLIEQAINPSVMASTLRILGLPGRSAPKSLTELKALASQLSRPPSLESSRLDEALQILDPNNPSFLEWDTRTHLGERKPADLGGCKIAVVGAGISGLIFAKHLSEAGALVTVYERSEVPGGTWGALSYEGARVDIGGLVYWPGSFQVPSFKSIFPTETELFRELNHVAAMLDESISLLYGYEVTELVRQSDKWSVFSEHADADGIMRKRCQVFEWVVIAAGRLRNSNASLARDKFPTRHFLSPGLRNLEKFEKKRVTVVGAAASGAQLATELNERAEKLNVIQSSPHYYAFNRFLREPVSQGQTWLAENIPFYREMLRAYFMSRSIRGNLDAVVVDPTWSDKGSVSKQNSELRDQLLEDMFRRFSGSGIPDSALTPDFPPGAKRIVLDNGDYPEIFSKGASLISSKAVAPTAEGLLLSNGDELRSDFVVWATGYKIQPPSFPVVDTGHHGGIPLARAWGSRQESFLGVMDWRFSNLFFAWGPNSNVVVHGSNTHMMGIQADFLVSLIDKCKRSGFQSATVKRESQDNYMKWLDKENGNRAWGMAGVRSWYRNSTGHVTENFPGDSQDYFSQMQKSKDWRDFCFE